MTLTPLERKQRDTLRAFIKGPQQESRALLHAVESEFETLFAQIKPELDYVHGILPENANVRNVFFPAQVRAVMLRAVLDEDHPEYGARLPQFVKQLVTGDNIDPDTQHSAKKFRDWLIRRSKQPYNSPIKSQLTGLYKRSQSALRYWLDDKKIADSTKFVIIDQDVFPLQREIRRLVLGYSVTTK